MAFVICCSIVCFSELQMKNKSPLSAPCINYCSNSRKNCSLLMGANGSNFGLLPFVAVSLKSSGKLNTGGLAGNEYASDTCLNAGRQFHQFFIATHYKKSKDLPGFESENSIFYFLTFFKDNRLLTLSHKIII